MMDLRNHPRDEDEDEDEEEAGDEHEMAADGDAGDDNGGDNDLVEDDDDWMFFLPRPPSPPSNGGKGLDESLPVAYEDVLRRMLSVGNLIPEDPNPKDGGSSGSKGHEEDCDPRYELLSPEKSSSSPLLRDALPRIASCSSGFFSTVGSLADMVSLLEDHHPGAVATASLPSSQGRNGRGAEAKELSPTRKSISHPCDSTCNERDEEEDSRIEGALLRDELLYSVMDFLDLDSLRSLSEASKRANDSCFAYLDGRLRRSLRVYDNEEASQPPPSPPVNLAPLAAPGLEHVRLLAKLDHALAETVVRETFRDKRTPYFGVSIRFLPSCEKFRLMVPGFVALLAAGAAAAAASYAGSSGACDVAASAAAGPCPSGLPSLELVEEGLTKLLQLGFVGGGLMKGAKEVAAKKQRRLVERQQQQQQLQQQQHDQEQETTGGHREAPASSSAEGIGAVPEHESRDSGENGLRRDDVSSTNSPFRPPASVARGVARVAPRLEETKSSPSSPTSSSEAPAAAEALTGSEAASPETSPSSTSPRGCVGAYRRVLARCHRLVRDVIKNKRKNQFDSLGEEEKLIRSSKFMEACRTNDASAVLALMEDNGCGVDVEGFYLGPDGTTTCGLHSAAFHNRCEVLRALLEDGCCDANLADGNGWTALHFAAGANSVESIRVLLDIGGADDSVEAGNGYTPLQWSERLQNAGAAAVLREAAAARRLQRQRPHHLLQQLQSELFRRFFVPSIERDGEDRLRLAEVAPRLLAAVIPAS